MTQWIENSGFVFEVYICPKCAGINLKIKEDLTERGEIICKNPIEFLGLGIPCHHIYYGTLENQIAIVAII